jgi:hypothetical protein
MKNKKKKKKSVDFMSASRFLQEKKSNVRLCLSVCLSSLLHASEEETDVKFQARLFCFLGPLQPRLF